MTSSSTINTNCQQKNENILTSAVYDRVRSSCWRLVSQAQEPLNPSHAHALCVPPVPFEAHLAIYLQQHNKLIRTTHHLHLKKVQIYADKWKNEGKSITEIAREKNVNFPPCSMLRLLLPYITRSSSNNMSGEGDENIFITSLNAADMMRDPNKISNERLRREVTECLENDLHVSPSIDRIRSYIGTEHEYRLQRLIHALSFRRTLASPIEFDTEQDLRRLRYKKTPDIRFRRPLIVECPHGVEKCRTSGGTGEHMICWVDSKATFGDPFTHEKSNDAQIKAYTHLFGPGLVIYWHGFVDALSSCLYPSQKAMLVNSHGVLLWTDFPSRWRLSTETEWAAIRNSLPPPPVTADVSGSIPNVISASHSHVPILEKHEDDEGMGDDSAEKSSMIINEGFVEGEIGDDSREASHFPHTDVPTTRATSSSSSSRRFDLGLFTPEPLDSEQLSEANSSSMSSSSATTSSSSSSAPARSSSTSYLFSMGECLRASNLIRVRQSISHKRKRESFE